LGSLGLWMAVRIFLIRTAIQEFIL
jgi:hypothetical protein